MCDTDAELELYLASLSEADMDRPHYAKHECIADLWQKERPKLLALPTTPFEVFRLEAARLNKYRELRFEKAAHPLPQCQALETVLLKVKWDEIQVLSSDGEYRVLGTLPRPYREKAINAELLFHVISDCYEQRSVIVTSNLEFGQWNTVFGDARLTAALVDRLVHHAYVLAFTGDSYRLQHALSEAKSS